MEHLQFIGDRQNAELERAVISRGEWSFLSEYRYLMRSEAEWFSHMTPEAKKRHLNKIYNTKPNSALQCNESSATSPSSALTPAVANTQSMTNISSEITDQHGLSVGWEQCGIMNISESTLQNIWRKAEQLLTCPQKQILSVPWSSDRKARLVKSSSTPQPHVVTSDPKNANIYRCDDKYPMYKGYSVCSHVIAAAEDNGGLQLFLESICKSCTPNLSAIADSGMPSGSGRKGGVPKRKRTKAQYIQSRSVRQCLSPPSTTTTTSSQTTHFSSILPSFQATNSGQFSVQNCYTQPSASKSYPPTANSIASTAYSCYITQTKNTTATTASGSTGPHRPLVGNLSSASISPTASSHSQVLVGGNVFNFASSPMSVIPHSNERLVSYKAVCSQNKDKSDTSMSIVSKRL